MANSPLSPNAWLRYDLVQEFLKRAPDASSFLEVGCGMGALAARLVERYDYVGFEPDVQSYEIARLRVAGRGDIRNDFLPGNPTRRFDILGAFEVLEHTKDDGSSLAGWYEWVRPTGHIILSVPANPARFGAADAAVGHYRRYSAAGLASLLRHSGFDQISVWSYGFPLGYVLEAARNLLASRPDTRAIPERTALSGRFYQPNERWAWATQLGTAPFRIAQRPFRHTRFGTGLVAMARRPA